MENLSIESLLILGVRMVLGLVAAIAALAVWSRSREPGLIFIILATIFNYIEILFYFLDLLGVLPYATYQIFGVSWIRIAFAGGIPLFLTLGFVFIFKSYDNY